MELIELKLQFEHPGVPVFWPNHVHVVAVVNHEGKRSEEISQCLFSRKAVNTASVALARQIRLRTEPQAKAELRATIKIWRKKIASTPPDLPPDLQRGDLLIRSGAVFSFLDRLFRADRENQNALVLTFFSATNMHSSYILVAPNIHGMCGTAQCFSSTTAEELLLAHWRTGLIPEWELDRHLEWLEPLKEEFPEG